MASRFSAGVQRGRTGRRVIPARRAAITTNVSWAMPATGTPHASAMPMSPPRQATTLIAAIRTMFSSTGAAAAAQKRPSAFRTPLASAASEMNRI